MPGIKPVEIDSLQNVEPAGRRQLWDRLPGESQKAFGAFVKFRDANERHVTEVARELTCSKQNVWKWSVRWRWEERAGAFDIHQDQLHQRQMARDRMEMNRRHVKLGVVLQSIGAHALAELQQRVEQKLALNLSATEAKELIETGAKIERAAHGPDHEDGQFAQIIVNLGDATELPGEAATPITIQGDAPFN